MKICLYGHGGSGNHGCEALVRSTAGLFAHDEITLYSLKRDQDVFYGIDAITKKIVEYHRYFKQGTPQYAVNAFLRYGFQYNGYYYHYANKNLLSKIDREAVYFSIGGDNYCYGNYHKNLYFINKRLSAKTKTVLWGASIEPALLEIPSVVEDLKRYALVTARESVTYNALLAAGVTRNTHLVPDTAFILESGKGVDVPSHTVGINISPLTIELGAKVYESYRNLVQYIISHTDYSVALIPHVVWEGKSDLVPLRELYQAFAHTHRVQLVDDANCMELKATIAKCELFVGARTHATIAAYASCVPTIVTGYSVKAKGIAYDLFGDDENYLISVQDMQNDALLTQLFIKLEERKTAVREHLQAVMPRYIQPIYTLPTLVKGVVR